MAASDLTPGAHVWLDLGDVKDVAELAVNGKYFGILWKAPYKVDITDSLRPGTNQFVIEVTNLWVNRLIGDQQPYAIRKYAFTDFTPYKADSPLLPSGLLGPMRLSAVSLGRGMIRLGIFTCILQDISGKLTMRRFLFPGTD